jgi:hypothetical protein
MSTLERVLPAVVLETSAAIAYLKSEPEAPDVESLLRLAEAGKIKILMSKFAWEEIKPDRQPLEKLGRLRDLAEHLPNVFRLDISRLDGGDVLGHDASGKLDSSSPRSASGKDREQLLSYAARNEMAFLVTKDGDFMNKPLRELYATHDLRIGTPLQCVAWLKSLGIGVVGLAGR